MGTIFVTAILIAICICCSVLLYNDIKFLSEDLWK